MRRSRTSRWSCRGDKSRRWAASAKVWASLVVSLLFVVTARTWAVLARSVLRTDVDRCLLGPNHPDTRATANNLASLPNQQGS